MNNELESTEIDSDGLIRDKRSGGNEYNYGNLSGQPIIGPRYEPWSCRLQSINAIHSVATFGESLTR